MKALERGLGWLFIAFGAVALALFYYLESLDALKIPSVLFWVANNALNTLLTYDLFHRHDLSTRSRTIVAVLIWIIPLVNWLIFFKNRNLARPTQPPI